MGNGEEVGKISYSVVIDVSALKAGTKTAEQAIKTSFNAGEKDIQKFASSADSSFSSVTKSLAVLTASFLSLRTISNVLGDSVDAANKFQSSMLGLESVSSAFLGETSAATEAAKALSSDGLLPLADSATGLKNLLAAGYGLPEAITLMERFKDSAAFGRQGSLSFGEAVKTATEGIKNGNSILVDNAGVTKNLSVILQEAGYSAQDLQKASTDVGVRMAILNGIVRETNAQVGDAARLTETAAGADAKLEYATEQLQVKIGNLANSLRKDATNSLADFIGQNQNAIISVGAGSLAFVGIATVIPLAIKGIVAATTAIKGMTVAGIMSRVAIFGVIGALSTIAAFAASGIIKEMLNDADGASDSTDNLNKSLQDTAGATSSAGSGVDKLEKKLRDLDDQINKVERDYVESLARIVQGHQKSVKDLTKQIEDENDKYNAAVSKRLTAFQEEQGKEESEHAKKVKNLQNQIDFLRKYQHSSNKQQLSDLQFALAQENSEYTKRNEERQAKYDADAEAERLSYQQRLDENQAKLDEELATLYKHRDSVKQVRDVVLLDEIEMLKRSRAEQLKSLEQQKIDARNGNASSGTAGGDAFRSNFNKEIDKMINDMQSKGTQAGNTFMSRFESAMAMSVRDPKKFWSPMVKSFENVLGLMTGKLEVKNGQIVMKSSGGGGWAEGGYTGAGGVNEVAGLVHRGEYVLPQSMVNQSTGMPKAEALEALGAGTSSSSTNTYQITIPISGAIVSSPQDQRKFAEVIGKKINEVMQQKGYKPALEGM